MCILCPCLTSVIRLECILVAGYFGDNTDNKLKFAITDTKLYVPFVTLSTQDDEKLLQQLKAGFKLE